MEQIRLMTILLASVVALLGFALSAKPVSAKPVSAKPVSADDTKPTWTKWKFDLDVVNDEMEATWYVTIGGEDKAGDPIDLYTQAFPLECNAVDDVKVDNGAIEFAGGYLECEFPDLMATANEIIRDKWGQQYELRPGPDCNCAPIKLGFVDVDATPKSDDPNPLFLHPSIAATLHVTKTGVLQEFRFGQETSTSPAIDTQPGATLTSRYLCDKTQGTCFFEHLYNGGKKGEEKRLFTIPSFYTGAITVHVGYDPDTKARFFGTIRDLVVDPGCRVN